MEWKTRKEYVCFVRLWERRKYRRYKKDLEVNESGSRKCECHFRLQGKPTKDGEGWMVDIIYGFHNHNLVKTLVGHPYADKLTEDVKTTHIDMTKTSAKPKNILLTLKEDNVKNMMMIKQIYNVMNTYRRSDRGHKTEM